MSTHQSEVESQTQSADRKHDFHLSVYPVDMSSLLALSDCTLDRVGVPCQVTPPDYHPIMTTYFALAHWNHYLATNDERHRSAFLAQAYWLVEHEVRIGEDASGWPITTPHHEVPTRGSWLSAIAQGCALSVLTRAFQLTGEPSWLELAQRVVRTFELDILDGGVSTPIGADGVFFEEVAVYPAVHHLIGCLVALLGLSDYVALTAQSPIAQLLARGLHTLQTLLGDFDRGYWTCAELGQRRLSSPAQLGVQVQLIEALACSAGRGLCSALAARWRHYPRRPDSRLRYQISRRCHTLLQRVQTALFPRSQVSATTRVCIPVDMFPATGGVSTVLDGLAQVMKDRWRIEYLTQYVGPSSEKYTIHRFGTRWMISWSFPFVWLCVLSGVRKFISLMREGAGYHVVMPQDGVVTGGLAALAGKLTGVRVVCIDHGHLSLFTDRNRHAYHTEKIASAARRHRPGVVKRVAWQLFLWNWPSRCLLARIGARFVDHYLIPGVAGDSIEEGCKIIGIHLSRITRFGSMIDINRHVLPDTASRATLREQKGLAADAIVVAIVCRLSPEKGLDIALESIHQALSSLSDERRERVRVIIAGDGPLRKQIAETIAQLDLSQYCLLYGELSADEVITLLGISDIFLYTSTRGACIPMSVLEAMASGCAVIASTEPLSNAVLLAEGRGIAVPSGDVAQTSKALTYLLNDLELSHRMGKLARDYIAVHHTPAMFRRTLLRATYWSELDELLASGTKTEPASLESRR